MLRSRAAPPPLVLALIAVAAFADRPSASAGSAPGIGAPGRPVCAARADIVRELVERYGETRRSLGIARGRGVFELFANSRSGSWTIIVTDARGTACLVAAGDAFRATGTAERPI